MIQIPRPWLAGLSPTCTLNALNELELISRLRPYLAPSRGALVIGAGEDDVAAWREADGSFTVASCDAFVEKVHFDLTRQDPEDVGWRAMTFALSDLAAKGASPTYGLVAISIPANWNELVIEGIYRGLAGLADEVGLRLIGGDTTSTPSTAALWLAVWGRSEISPIPRSKARAGWVIGVSGPLGGASLQVKRPRPRLELGAELVKAGVCCGDISDGLLRELDKFAAAAPGIGARLEISAVPTVGSVSRLEAIVNGEEVELVGVAPDPLPPQLIRVGELTDDGVVRVVDSDGQEIEIKKRGYEHFE